MMYPQSRREKIAFLQKVATGKASVKDLLEPITGVVFIHNDKVYTYQTRTEQKVFEPETSLSEYKRLYGL